MLTSKRGLTSVLQGYVVRHVRSTIPAVLLSTHAGHQDTGGLEVILEHAIRTTTSHHIQKAPRGPSICFFTA